MRKLFAPAVAALALAGCGMIPGPPGAGGGEERQTQTAAQESAQQAQPTQTSTQAPTQTSTQTSTGSAQQAPAQDTTVIATREAKTGAGDMHGAARVDITSLRRQGKTVSLTWTVTATDGKVNLHNGMGRAALDFTVSNVSLIDPVNAKRYRVARNGTSEDAGCVCSGTQGQFLESGDASTLYAVFAAPPPDVTKINVEMPMIGVLSDVPIS
ncbi:hypothetical protein AB0K18_33375 [Nonomuraea sp. NPDC049421]|uniref:hypothetical protein n=1 Tax=Nonomuraea sp. NPDC049421 TaxID=3155275 RepID=UPI003427A081